MKLCVKKIYCPHCRQAVKGQELLYNGPYRVLCSKCGQTICISNGIYWSWAPEAVAAPAKENEGPSPEKPKRAKASKTKKQSG